MAMCIYKIVRKRFLKVYDNKKCERDKVVRGIG